MELRLTLAEQLRGLREGLFDAGFARSLFSHASAAQRAQYICQLLDGDFQFVGHPGWLVRVSECLCRFLQKVYELLEKTSMNPSEFASTLHYDNHFLRRK